MSKDELVRNLMAAARSFQAGINRLARDEDAVTLKEALTAASHAAGVITTHGIVLANGQRLTAVEHERLRAAIIVLQSLAVPDETPLPDHTPLLDALEACRGEQPPEPEPPTEEPE